jgi:L-galactose dehydrogenase
MRYRPLGKTGLQVSVLGFGASPLGGVFGAIDEAEGIRAVHTALDLGINFFDVAPYYGLTRAEAVLGKALATVPRDAYLLATKVGRYGADDFDFSADRVTASVEESLQRLGVETLDLLHCHDIEFGALDQIVAETLPALRRLQAQGKVRFLGISGYPLKIFREVPVRAPVDVILSYCRCCLCDTALEALIPFLQAQQLGIINASPLAMGLLTEQGARAWHPAPAALQAACARAAAHCRDRGGDLARLALQFAVAQATVATTLVGMATTEEVRRNVAAIQAAPDAELLAEVQAILQPVRGTTWASGRTENRDG